MRIFVAGAAGYIGGSLVEHFRDLGHEVSGLVRSEEKASFLRTRGIAPVIGALSDGSIVSEAARAVDAVVNAAEADDADLVRPLLSAIEGTGKGFIHTSGSSIVVDDAQGAYAGEAIFADDQPFAILPHRRPRAGVDVMVRTAGVTSGIRAAVICPTLIYGEGRGWKRDSHQVPFLTARSIAIGAGAYIGEGRSIWSNVFLGDVLDLYARAIERAPSGAFFFAENGESAWRATAEALSHSLGSGGRTASWAIDDAVAEVGGVARVALASNCRVRATNARRLLDWQPSGPTLAENLRRSS